jgi:ATP-dependent exoDNAse (exonuclease V) beta subunit
VTCSTGARSPVPALSLFVDRQVHVDTAAAAAAAFIDRARGIVSARHRSALLDDGPRGVPEYQFVREGPPAPRDRGGQDAAWVQQLRRRIEGYFFTRAGEPRKRLLKEAVNFATPSAKRRHADAVSTVAPALHAALRELDADVNGLLAKGLQRVLAIAVRKYEALLEEHAMLDFAGMLDRAVTLLGRQEEFARSRLKLQSRFHHLLIDEFQDTSRRQWQLIDLLIQAWAEGEGTAEGRTSIFVVADRKQSIYRFRNAEVTLLEAAAERIAALRTDRPVRLAINTSFRAVPELLAFVNAFRAACRRSGT